MTITKAQSHILATKILTALDSCQQITPVSKAHPGLTLECAYEVASTIREIRQARGERTVGRKIGFTNRNIWSEYNVFAPIWGDMYDTTVHDLAVVGGKFDLSLLPEPRIEPEIAFGFAHPPEPDMDERALLSCVGWIAHGFEIVQSVFADWQFTAADTIAAFGLHGAYLMGPRYPISGEQFDAWFKALSTFEITLERDGELVDHGHASDVLGGPLSALRHLVESLSESTSQRPVTKGDIVTTGTLTRAFPIASGETWRTTISGLPIGGITVSFV